MMLIGFTGGYGVGKSSAINQLGHISKQPLQIIKFAQPLYDIQDAAYSRISSVYKRPSTFVKDRKLLQWLGTDWGRDSISKTLWVDLWKSEVRDTQENAPWVNLIVCDDCRFDNEAEAIKSMGGIIIKLTRTNANPEGGTGISNHASEAGISDKYIDYVVKNDGTLDDLKASLGEIYSNLKAGQSGDDEAA